PAPRQEAAASSLDERMIVELCLAGESHHFRRLVERYQRGILRITFRMLGRHAEAEDIAQQTFIDAFTALRDFNPELRSSSWLYRIAVNNCKDWLKSKKRGELPLTSDVPVGEAVFAGRVADPETAAQAGESRDRIQSALARVARKYREVLVLKDME